MLFLLSCSGGGGGGGGLSVLCFSLFHLRQNFSFAQLEKKLQTHADNINSEKGGKRRAKGFCLVSSRSHLGILTVRLASEVLMLWNASHTRMKACPCACTSFCVAPGPILSGCQASAAARYAPRTSASVRLDDKGRPSTPNASGAERTCSSVSVRVGDAMGRREQGEAGRGGSACRNQTKNHAQRNSMRCRWFRIQMVESRAHAFSSSRAKKGLEANGRRVKKQAQPSQSENGSSGSCGLTAWFAGHICLRSNLHMGQTA